MSRSLSRRLAVVAVTVAGVGASAGAAMAGASFKVTVSPSHISRGGTVTILTTPRMSCRLTVTIAKRPFSHEMKYGWIKVHMPGKDGIGRFPVKVTCAGTSQSSAFTIG